MPLDENPATAKRVPPTEVAAAMFAGDAASQALGIEITEVGDGTATASLTVTPAMDNGLGVCHGGIIFTLADVAMAYGSNSGNERTLASGASIELLAPAPIGAQLVATGTVAHQRGRNTVHDIPVRSIDPETGEATLVALFRGRTLTLGGAITGESAVTGGAVTGERPA